MAVQERRANRALEQVRIQNEALRQKESERDTVRARWDASHCALERERQDYVDAVASSPRCAVSAADLAGRVLRCEWRRARAEELQNLLRTAQAVLAAAQAAAAEAQRSYRRAHARHEALLLLAAKGQRARNEVAWRAAEHAASDLQAYRQGSR